MAEDRQDRLVRALEALKTLQDAGPCFAIKGATVLGETNTKVLLDNGFLENVLRGWYIPSTPAHAGTTTSWYACFWGFVSAYCHARFGEDWVLTPEESLSVWSGANIIPQQVVVQAAKGSNTVQPLKHNTSIFNFTTRIPNRIEHEPAYGLNVYPIAAALLRCSPSFYSGNAEVARACLNALGPDVDLKTALGEYGGEAYVNRLVGALLAVGREDLAAFVKDCQISNGRKVTPENPFVRKFEPVRLPERSPLASRIRLTWQEMRGKIRALCPADLLTKRSVEEVLAEMDAGYVADSYHSLSIEGYRVSEELIRRVRDGQWSPDRNADDESRRNAMAASGYYRAYRKVRSAVERAHRGEDAGSIIADQMDDWHRELFMPCVDAGLLKASDLYGYRRTQVYIAGSRYTPPAATKVSDAMEAYLDLVRTERDPVVRAVLGHFFLVHIHPYADGNGRTARFVMNASLASAGLKWKVITVDQREAYMQALENASIKGEIEEFGRLVVGEGS